MKGGRLHFLLTYRMRELTGLVMPKKYWVRTGETVKDLRAIFSNRSFKHSPAHCKEQIGILFMAKRLILDIIVNPWRDNHPAISGKLLQPLVELRDNIQFFLKLSRP
jgi:hypothetical protein